ncbi:hypothetical protein Cs7R123_42920 [Catellatospora sp. TT07R-123]|uniref:hypothetical protein n=1 Tax=Catellatospora sp. TT07R-123 TaxID=2733863 RepID=UPI001B197866|nr:hypothetical protein [Catellatospora sp. TT07R-123]GHJ46950.1 hypothetical protein Cs7R123_42920 [Catellatospora sp. TT07R-123]
MRQLTARLSAIALLAMLVPLLNGPAYAGPAKTEVRMEIPADAVPFAYLVADNGKPVDFSIRTEKTASGKAVVFTVSPQVITCTAWSAPKPTYSGNQTSHTMHFGISATCSAAISIRLRVSLWNGPTSDDITTVQYGDGWKYVTGSGGDNPTRNCVDWGYSTWWKLLGYAEADSNGDMLYEHFNPYPGEAVSLEGCADIV